MIQAHFGKPTAQKISEDTEVRNWDPTDPDENNPWKKYVNKTPEQAAKPSSTPSPSPTSKPSPTPSSTSKPTQSPVPSSKPSPTSTDKGGNNNAE